MARGPIVSYGVQSFVLVKGELAQGHMVRCKDPAEACQLAAEKVRLGYAIGAAAFTRTVTDPDWDDGEEPVTLATFGRVPEGVRDQLPF